MKLSSYHKAIGDSVELINIDEMNGLFQSQYDKVYCSKVFSDTETPKYLQNKNIQFGGSGFYFDKAEQLPFEIEHSIPDYNLYSKKVISKYVSSNKTHFFTDFSIGFTTRGCIRHCSFCINKNSSKVEKWSPVDEFIDTNRPFIMLWDDNVMASQFVFNIFDELNNTKKPFVYKQGLDIRLINNDKAKLLLTSNYYKPKNTKNKVAHFAFDNIKDSDLIQNKIELMNSIRKSNWVFTFYVFCGYSHFDNNDYDFWMNDIFDLVKRIKILFESNCQPYVMKHENYKKSPLKKWYDLISGYCNSPINYGKTLKSFLLWHGIKESEIFFESDFKIQITKWSLNNA